MNISKINIVLFSALSMVFSSCLDLEPKAQLAETNLWQDVDQYKLFASQFYGWTRDFVDLDDGPHSDGRSDLRTGATLDIYSNGTYAIPSSDDNYTDNYNRIRQVNLLLSNAESYPIPEDIAVYVGEAKFFRAYLHFDLVQIYGNIIMVDKPLTVTSSELHKERDDRGKVIDFIIQDLQDAIEVLPSNSEISTDDLGRVSKQAAQAFLSRVALYEGTWQKFRNDGQVNNERSSSLLGIAAKAADEVIKSGEFSLFKPADLSTNAYKYMFILEDTKSNPASIKKDANNEYIFSRRHDEVLRPIGFNITQGRLGNAVYITRKLANMYLTSDGLPINEEETDYSTMNSEFKNRDNRMAGTLMVSGEYYWSNGPGRVNWTGDAEDKASATFKPFYPSDRGGSGYFTQKWCTERTVATGKEAYDFPIIRYAEVLLNYAEAVFERDGTISDDDLKKSINLVRKRVNPDMPDLTNSFVDTNNLDMRTEIRRERTVELFDEGFRMDDLKRWKTAETEMTMDLLGVKYVDTEFQKEWPDMSNPTNSDGCIVLESGRVWQDKHYLYPLPTDQLKLNPNLKQNPGWE
ncbi:RagB/SusD family nutrient uptake outer membrane protein [uncultured Bacteroides sp.]|uniref:RagB/SusD family nutrient uptake outer membrane protein n=1 Tax=uncultured Bacteroides sp. TaxID=162156 RepID=UPI0025E8D4B8|nr:RagB/SusD family nutrient uptake outer membrane protein [uncultured Bacteroides sp.]